MPTADAAQGTAGTRVSAVGSVRDCRKATSAWRSCGLRRSGPISGPAPARYRAAAGVVEADDVGEGGQDTVVHVGGGEGHVAQRGGTEGAPVGFVAGDGEAPRVFGQGPGLRDAEGVEAVVGEQRRGVAGRTTGLALKERQALLLLPGELRPRSPA